MPVFPEDPEELLFRAATVDKTWLTRFAASMEADGGWLEQCRTAVSERYASDVQARDGYSRIGWALMRLNRLEEAIAVFALDWEQRRMGHWQSLRYLEALTAAGRLDEAARLVPHYYERHPRAQDGWATVGRAYHLRKEFEVAHGYYERDASQGRLSPARQVLFGECRARQGDWIEAERQVERAYAADAALRDGFARLAGVALDEKDHSRILGLLRRDEEQHRLTPPVKLRLAEWEARSGRWNEALELVTAAYERDAALRDGFSRIAEVARGRRTAWRIELWQRDAANGRQSPRAALLHAQVAALARDWKSAREIMAKLRQVPAEGCTWDDAFVGGVLGEVASSCERWGLTRVTRAVLEPLLGFITADARETFTPEKRSICHAQCLSLLGLDDQAASLLGSAHDGAASLTEATGWELANSLVLGGDFARASRYYRLLNVDAPPSAWAAGLRAWMLLEQGETNASHSYISEVERRQVEFRGIRTIVAWRWLSGLQASWVSAGGDVPPDATLAQRCRAAFEEDLSGGRSTERTYLGLAQLDMMEARTSSAQQRIADLYSHYPEFRNAHGRVAMVLQRAGRFSEVGGWYLLDFVAGRAAPGIERLWEAAFQARRGDVSAARRLIEEVAQEAQEVESPFATTVEALLTGFFREPEAVQAERLTVCTELLEADYAIGRARDKTLLVDARVKWLRGDRAGALARIRELYETFPLHAAAHHEFGALCRMPRLELLTLEERDLAEGRLNLPHTRQVIRLLAAHRSEDARQTALRQAEWIRRSPAEIMQALHAEDPYAEFDAKAWPDDRHGWHHETPLFDALIERTRSSLIIEVGTWKGASAIAMAGACRARGLSSHIVCVDTWLGAIEFWLNQNDATRYRALGLRHGYPSVYYQFLANCCHAGVQDIIVPFPQTSTTAALWFVVEGFRAGLIYVDASHTYEDVRRDVAAFWDVLEPGGIIFGDDYGLPDVARAVREFAGEQKLEVQESHGCWVLHKPSAFTGPAT